MGGASSVTEYDTDPARANDQRIPVAPRTSGVSRSIVGLRVGHQHLPFCRPCRFDLHRRPGHRLGIKLGAQLSLGAREAASLRHVDPRAGAGASVEADCSKRARIDRPRELAEAEKRHPAASSIGCSDLRCLPRISSRQSWRSGSRRGCNCRILHGRCRVCGRRSERRWVNYNRSGSNR